MARVQTLLQFGLVLGLGLVSILFAVYNSKTARIKRRMRRLTRTRITEVREGTLVKICGTVSYLSEPAKTAPGTRS
jgi:hypothetical protein